MRSTVACVLVVVVGCVAGCSLDRRGIGANPGRDASVEPMDAQVIGEDASVVGDDATIGEDATIVGEDATVVTPDSGPPDAGIPCGASGQSCCDPVDSCDLGLACSDSTCVPCGRLSGPCCAGACIDGSACSGGACVPSCGGDGQPCCGDICNDPGLTCDRPLIGGAGTCRPCGDETQPCCGGLCNGGSEFYCDVLSDCRRCGGFLTRCCDGYTCRTGTCDRDWDVCR